MKLLIKPFDTLYQIEQKKRISKVAQGANKRVMNGQKRAEISKESYKTLIRLTKLRCAVYRVQERNTKKIYKLQKGLD